MINLSLDELKLIAQNRNIQGYEKKSEEDLIKKKYKTYLKRYIKLHKFSKEGIDQFRKSF